MINFHRWLERLHISETIILWSLAVGEGLTTAAGVVVGLLVHFFIGTERYHNVAEIAR